jgi:hypothetical protein
MTIIKWTLYLIIAYCIGQLLFSAAMLLLQV